MGLVKLNVYKRTTTGKNENRRTRAAGFIPAVIYGSDRESVNCQIDTVQFTKIMKLHGGRSTIFDLDLEGEDENPIALMREVQQHPVTDVYRHVDLFEIPRGVPVNVEVNVVLEGEPESVRFGDTELVQVIDRVEIACMPRDVPESISIDVSNLEINDKIFVKDMTLPVGEMITDGETQVLVLKAATLFVEEEEESEAGVGEVAEGETESEDSKSDD